MNSNAVKYGVIGLVMGSFLTFILVGIQPISNVNAMMRMMNNNDPAPRMMEENMDRHFIEQMIPHHEDAITMAKLALEKTKRPEIRNLSQNIIKAQDSEIVQMTQWYQDWYGSDVPQENSQMEMHGMMGQGGMHMGMMGDETDMQALNSASDFDREFIEQMIPHHQMAVMMANMLKAGTSRPEMQQLAQNITSSQTQEINQMRSWYKTWYL